MGDHVRERGSRTDRRGQSETIGVVLVLAMTLIGATAVLAIGATGLDDARVDMQEGGVQQAFTQLDSRTAMAALGDSPTQSVKLAATGRGGYRIDADAGWINVTHIDYDGSGSNETIYNESLGALVYQNDDTLIGYQGGGVWVARGNASRMVSPPEFHYRSATLTFPVIRVEGDTSSAGVGVTADIVGVARAKHIYPNLSRQYGATGDTFVNPVREGNVTVTVKSDFYEAWADYFRSRTTGKVSVDHTSETVTAKLISQGVVGEFQMPADGNSLEIRGLGSGHPITNFTIVLRPDDTDSANFANLQWSLYADEGSKEFELHLRDGGKNDDPATGDCTERDVQATVYYSENGGNPYEGWHDPTAFRTRCDDHDSDGNNETYLVANMTGTRQLTMQSLSSSDINHFDPAGDTLTDPATFDQHSGVAWEPKSFDTGGDADTTIGNLTNHYVSLMGPNLELHVEDKGSNTVNEDASYGALEQTGSGGQFITFLHITENRVSIELE